MRKVETYGLYYYIVEGEREDEAAEELDRTVDFLNSPACRHLSGEEILTELADARKSICEKFGVTIKASI